MKPVYVTTNPHEKAMQRALIQYRNPKNYDLVYEALMKADRKDLIGFEKKCLIKPRKFKPKEETASKENERSRANTKNKGNAQKKKAIRNVHKKKR